MRIIITSMPMIALVAILSASANDYLRRQAVQIDISAASALPEAQLILQKVHTRTQERRAKFQ